MRQSLFKRIIVLYIVILALAMLGSEIFLTRAVRTSSIRELRNVLETRAALIARDIPVYSGENLDALCRKIKTVSRTRVTIIAEDGSVLGDSDSDSSLMENHRDRIEVQQAALTGSGMSIRRSDTLKVDLLYVAIRMDRRGERGFVRLSLPLTDVEATVNSLRIKVLLVVTAILLATGLFSLWQIDRLRRITLQVRDFATSVANGDFGKRLFLTGAGEFDEIAASLNAMSEELQQVIAASDEEKKRLGIILKNIPDALLIIDFGGTIQLASSASRKFFGGHTALKGRPYVEIVRDHEFLGLIEDVRRDLAPGVAELRLEHPEERDCVVRVAPLFYQENELAGFIALFHDVTQLKKLERMRTDFVANLSHEIRTPITAVSGFADTLLDGALEDRENARKFIATIKANSERISSLVDDLMTISKIELGVIKVKKAPVDIAEVAETINTLFGEQAKAKQLTLSAKLPAGAQPLPADRDRLIQILTNLVDNAIKFTDAGKVTFGLREEDGRTVLFVEDTGIGVPEKHLPRLGERFYRVDAARSRTMGGTGLGLAIVKHLVKAHGWEMEISSTEGKGTAVRIYV